MAVVKFQGKEIDPDTVWADWFAGSAFAVDKRLRRINRLLPHDPRCKFCNVPFEGAGALFARTLLGKERSPLNPRFCNMCDEASRRFPGGAEVQMTMLFADIRGSTALSEKMRPAEYGRLIQRFYAASTKLIIASDGLVEKLAGDEVVAFWGAGFAGQDYVKKTIHVAQHLSRVLADQGIPAGIGIHFGIAYFGAMGTPEGLCDISAKGDAVNTAARLASQAAAGEIIASEPIMGKAGIDASGLESRRLQLKGLSEPVPVRVLHGGDRLPARPTAGAA